MLFAIGNLGSKLLQIFLVPFYTRVMTDSEYGTVDVMQSVVSLLLPIVSLTIYESVFRYAMDQDYDKGAVLSTGLAVTAVGALVICALGGVVSAFYQPLYIWLVIANTVANALRTLLSQYTRAVGKTGLFSLDNVLMTFMVLMLNILFIAVFKLGIVGYMLGYTLANLLSALFLCILLGKFFVVDHRRINRPLTKELLIFSIPLIPNAVCWWITSFIDRLMIVFFVSTAANGLYAAAHKIPSLLSMVVTIFFQAWQVSANEEFKKKDIAQFYSKIFEKMSACIFVLSSLLILFSRPINSIFLGEDYSSAWVYMPPLIISMTFYSFAQYLGSIYTANKKTKMAFVTNFIGVIVSVGLNLILIPLIGTIGAAIANASSYLVLWIVRIFDTGRIVRVKYDLKRIIPVSVILVLQAVFICLDLNTVVTYSVCAVGTVAITVIYFKQLLSILKFALGFAKKILVRR